jgi:hypothetical protein
VAYKVGDLVKYTGRSTTLKGALGIVLKMHPRTKWKMYQVCWMKGDREEWRTLHTREERFELVLPYEEP